MHYLKERVQGSVPPTSLVPETHTYMFSITFTCHIGFYQIAYEPGDNHLGFCRWLSLLLQLCRLALL